MPPSEEADDTESEVELGPEEEDGDGETLGDELVAIEGEEELDDDDQEDDEGLGKSFVHHIIRPGPV